MTTPLEAVKAAIEALEPIKTEAEYFRGSTADRVAVASYAVQRAAAAHALLSQVEGGGTVWLRPATEPDWDTYGGKPTTPEAIKTARRLVGVPLPDGGIQIELDDAEIIIGADGAIVSVELDDAPASPQSPAQVPSASKREAALEEAAQCHRKRAIDAHDEENYAAAQRHEEYALDILALASTPPKPAEIFQDRVQLWMLACFNAEITADRLERADRFIEEALELIQSGGYDKARAHALVEYVYGRPQGDINQEVGGVMVTLAAYCLAFGVNMHEEAERELSRINRPEIIEKIRAKQAAKPKGSALPVAANLLRTEKPAAEDVAGLLKELKGEKSCGLGVLPRAATVIEALLRTDKPLTKDKG